MKFFGTGFEGFLLSGIGLKKSSMSESDIILVFGCPSNEEPLRLAESILTTSEMIRIAQKTKKKLVFASSEGAKNPKTNYEMQKKVLEDCILTLLPDSLILRIPRVYDKTRKKGLMFLLRTNKVPESDMENEVEFISLEMFKTWFFESLKKSGIVEYSESKLKMTLKKIKSII